MQDDVTVRCRTCKGTGEWVGIIWRHKCDDCVGSGWMSVPKNMLIDSDIIDDYADDELTDDDILRECWD